MTGRPTYQDLNEKKTQVTRTPKLQTDPNVKKTQMTWRSKWQEDPSDKKTQVTKRPKQQENSSGKKDPNYRKTQMTRRPMWQEKWVAQKLTNIMLTDGKSPICWMSISKNILKLYSFSKQEENNTSTISWSIPQ